MCVDDGGHVWHAAITDFEGEFLLNILWSGEFVGKWVLMSFRNMLATLVLTLLLYGGLNQMILRFLFRFCLGGCVIPSVYPLGSSALS